MTISYSACVIYLRLMTLAKGDDVEWGMKLTFLLLQRLNFALRAIVIYYNYNALYT